MNPVLTHFESWCKIPHPSHHTEAMQVWLRQFADSHSLDCETDHAGNILMRKPASPGRESAPVVALQAHIDMVPQPLEGRDWTHDPVTVRLVPRGEDSEFPDAALLKADGTSLGADCGIGACTMLALLAGDEPSPALECLFTVDEETGMHGANALRTGWLKAKYMLNLDAESEGVLMTACAGAVDLTARFRYGLTTVIPDGDQAVKLSLSGLRGGHSGMDIHMGRGNACKLMCRFLKHAVVNFEARLSSFNAGSLRNAIPRTAEAVITVPGEIVDEVIEEVAYYNALFRDELRGIDDGVNFSAGRCAAPASLMPEEIQDDILNTLEAVHDGVFRYSPDIPGLVETSSNLASVSTRFITDSKQPAGETEVLCLVRSQGEEMKRWLASSIQSTFLLGGARVEFGSSYPGWELSPGSGLLSRAKDVWSKTFGDKPVVTGVHCGLECGVISSLYPHMDILSVGPTIHHPHSPNESVEIESVGHFWTFIRALLASF